MAHLSNKRKSNYFKLRELGKTLFLIVFIYGIFVCFSNLNFNKIQQIQQKILPTIYGTPSLVMKGGDPYIRALMRTISASEANSINPYHIVYSGKYVQDLSNHPNLCVKIVKGPNEGKCTTAAGRYQFLNNTWAEKASKYHPKPQKILRWKKYSFEAEYQDAVIYNWLTDSQAWGVDISQELRQGKIEEIFKLLSPTWTSLGYGIEDNFMSKYLPIIYQNMLEEELRIKN